MQDVDFSNTGNIANVVAEFYDPVSENDYFFNVGNGTGILGYVPPSTYNVTIYETCCYTTQTWQVCNNSTTAYEQGVFNGIPINTSCHNITIF
jgi:hypothetical protein